MLRGGKNKKGQLTIFIILAIVIVAAVLILLVIPNPLNILQVRELNANSYLEECIEPDLQNALELISLQGGIIEPEHYFEYQGMKIEYLCYTSEYYKTCVMQKPMLKQDIEEEILKQIMPKINTCTSSLVREFEKRGYSVSAGNVEPKVNIVPNSIIISLEWPFSASKESTINYKSFKLDYDNRMYSLLMITSSILNWEARYGDAESTLYMSYYPDIKVQKKKQSEGTTIYLLEDRMTGDKFNFASRSLPWPAGLGLS